MSDCKWAGSENPRVLRDRHDDGCGGEGCGGCLPCPERHCAVCGKEDVTYEGRGNDQTCAECIGFIRDDLNSILAMSARLLGEAIQRGLNSQAAMLSGPSADPEAWGYRRMSALAGRIDPSWLEDCQDELHPTWVVGTWEMLVREHLCQPATLRLTLTEAVDYLDGHLTRLAHDAEFPIEEIGRDLRACRSHLENVLSDGVRAERTRVTCTNVECRRRPRLERRYGQEVRNDVWACPSCGMTYNDREYRDAHATQLRHKGAERYMPVREAIATLVSQGRGERTVRKWLGPNLKHHEDQCTNPECGATMPPKMHEGCRRCGADLTQVWKGDADAVIHGYCELASRKVFVWWPDLWGLHNIRRSFEKDADRVA